MSTSNIICYNHPSKGGRLCLESLSLMIAFGYNPPSKRGRLCLPRRPACAIRGGYNPPSKRGRLCPAGLHRPAAPRYNPPSKRGRLCLDLRKGLLSLRLLPLRIMIFCFQLAKNVSAGHDYFPSNMSRMVSASPGSSVKHFGGSLFSSTGTGAIGCRAWAWHNGQG